MSLSSDLISQFVKVTKETKPTNKETTVYGTAVEFEGRTWVRLDGSDRLTPITKTTDINDGERVTVLIKDHTATVTGNKSSPSARTDDVKELGGKISEFEIIVADKVSVDELEAESARIDNLLAENVAIRGTLSANEALIKELKAENVEIEGKLTANEAEIEKLETNKLDASVADIKFATIENLEATNADIYNLEATYGKFESLATNKFTAIEADVSKLNTDKLDATQADIKYATIENLEATNADIGNLSADIADIDTLIFGSASGSVIQTSFANAVIAQLGNAQIKSAMIDNVSASKINAGDINTNNVRVVSEDGSLVISDETIQIKDSSRVRVQIGKDASGDYSINIWDADGKLMFSEGGITDSAIKDAIIRNDMVSDTANISASKLDISSLFEEINGSTKTIKSSKIYLDDAKQTLDVAFTELETDLEDTSDTVTSQGTQLSVIQGQIENKIWQQDINSATGELNTKYNTLSQTVDGISSTVASHSTTLTTKADTSTVTAVDDRVTSLSQTVDGISSTVSSHSTTLSSKADKSEVTTMSNKVSNIEQNVDSISSTVSRHTTTLSNKADKSEVEAIDIGGRNLLPFSRIEYNGATLVEGTTTKHLKLSSSGQYDGISIPYDLFDLNADYILSYDLTLLSGAGSVGGHIGLAESAECYVDGSYVGSYANAVSLAQNKKVHVDVFIKTAASVPESTPNIYIQSQRASSSPIAMDYLVENLKVESGNKATDWTPAPEDVDEGITQAQEDVNDAKKSISDVQSVIQQLADSISQLVRNGETSEGSLVKQDANGLWYFDISDIKDDISNTEADIDELSGIVRDTNGNINVLQSLADALAQRTEYVRSYVDENDKPCLELGEGDSNFKVLITNTEIRFMDGSTVPAYISNQKLMIENAEVKGELQQGSFIWKTHGKGNLGLMWIGE